MGDGVSENMALVVQCFAKCDTLLGLCKSLMLCHGHEQIDLIFWSDSPVEGRQQEKYIPLCADVQIYLDNFIEKESGHFKSITRRQNDVNLGPYKTCEIALDFAFSRHYFVIFAEDDVIFARDALDWFDVIRKHQVFAAEENWAITGEAIFFDARDKHISPERVAATSGKVLKQKLNIFYVIHNFLPSTCFATTREKWVKFGQTRGQSIGDVEVCRRCQEEGRYCIFPVVPRVKDIGMLHDNGYSVMIHSKEGVSEAKNTYILSDVLLEYEQRGPQELVLYTGELGPLFSETTLLDGIV